MVYRQHIDRFGETPASCHVLLNGSVGNGNNNVYYYLPDCVYVYVWIVQWIKNF